MNAQKNVVVTLRNGDEWVGAITKRGRSETRMTLTDGRLNIVPTWAIKSVVEVES